MQQAATNMDLPLIALRDVVVFPQMVIPLFIGRETSIHAIEAAMQLDKQLLLITQREADVEDPSQEDLYPLGTLGKILQFLRLPDGTVKILVEGLARVELNDLNPSSLELANKKPLEYLQASVSQVNHRPLAEQEEEALRSLLIETLANYINTTKQLNVELLTSLEKVADLNRLADTLASHLKISLEDKQRLLEEVELEARYSLLLFHLEAKQDQVEIQKRIQQQVRQQMDKNQREYFLNEQIKVIHKELGKLDETGDEFEQLAEKIATLGLTDEAKKQATKELKKLKTMQANSAEASLVRSYLDWLVNLPWKKSTRSKVNLAKAEELLNEQHYGLEEVKDRILDYLAVQQRVKKIKGTVLCLVGPPGVGKTSLGESIAKATNRKFIRLALGGVHDEAEIRGHRRTYLGSMPGKLIQRLSKTGVNNPLILLDEIDKLGRDHRGDPAAALLEVLDPEQNHKFNDNYLEVDYDLSNIMFVCTANSMNIPAPLLDRMEIIRLAGYTEDEKLHIATNHLLPKQKEDTGLAAEELQLNDDNLLHLIRHYTKEAGVRQLERQLAKICRKHVRQLDTGKEAASAGPFSQSQLEDFLGVRKYTFGLADKANQVGKVTGLAWTSVGGELLDIEVASMPGKGKLIRTGSLGDVMQESMQAALTVVRTRGEALGLNAEFFENHDTHLHLPEGATPKDGPSAGIGIYTALVSAFTGIPVKANLAMTGEVNLRGEVLQIGGLKEKLLAAKRGGITQVLIPESNLKDLQEIPEALTKGLEILPVEWVEEVLDLALESQPLALSSMKANVKSGENLVLKTH